MSRRIRGGNARRALALAASSIQLTAAGLGDASAAEPDVLEDYRLHCSACHGADGAGTPDVVPGLGGLAVLLETPAGRAYLARVPGVAQAPLSDGRLARLLNWVLPRFSKTSPQPPYTPAEVAELRALPLRDPRAARRAALARPRPR